VQHRDQRYGSLGAVGLGNPQEHVALPIQHWSLQADRAAPVRRGTRTRDQAPLTGT
jgi:hypothetical protein